LLKEKDSWLNAQMACEKLGANLASIENEAEKFFVLNLVSVIEMGIVLLSNFFHK